MEGTKSSVAPPRGLPLHGGLITVTGVAFSIMTVALEGAEAS